MWRPAARGAEGGVNAVLPSKKARPSKLGVVELPCLRFFVIMSYRISLSNKSSSVTFVVCIFGEMLHTMHNFLQEKLRACNDTRRAAAEAALKQQQQVRTKLPPDRHSERRFLLLLPSLPLTEGAAPRASIPKQKKKGKILITLALNLSLSLRI